MTINWEQVGDQKFNVYDNFCGFWADTADGFTHDQKDAKVYTVATMTETEKKAAESGCILLSA